MNTVNLTGNLTKTPEKRTTPSGTSVATFTVAVQRDFKNEQGSYDADFINCVAWRNTADFVAKYFDKGQRIGVVGRLQTRSYDDQNGNKRYITEVIAENVEFEGSKKAETTNNFSNNEDDIVELSLANLEGDDLPF